MFFPVFIFGLFIGSFLNVLSDRFPKGEAVVKGRSHCDKCRKTLVWHDLIPLLSFVFLKGKCRYCKTSLSFYYPIVELTTGILFMLTTFFVFNGSQFFPLRQVFEEQAIFNFQLLIPLIYYLFIVSSLIVIFFADLKYGIIPDKIIFPVIFISIIYLILNTQYAVLSHLFSALGACLFFLFLSLIKIKKRESMGIGDVKFAFLMGLILGFPNIIVSLYIAFLTGAIVGCILILWRKKRVFGTSIPFGPFLVTGTLGAIFYGEILIQGFLRLASL